MSVRQSLGEAIAQLDTQQSVWYQRFINRHQITGLYQQKVIVTLAAKPLGERTINIDTSKNTRIGAAVFTLRDRGLLQRTESRQQPQQGLRYRLSRTGMTWDFLTALRLQHQLMLTKYRMMNRLSVLTS